MVFDAVNEALVNLLLAVITGAVGFVGTKIFQFLHSKLNNSQLELLDSLAANVVLAVEQSTFGQEIVASGADKKRMAEELLASFLQKYSITLKPEQIDAAIESAVANVLNANKLVEPPKVVEVDSGPDFS